MNLGFWYFYTFYNKNRMFKESVSTVGDNLNYPMFYLGQHLTKLGHKVNTIDMDDLSKFDKVFFMDYPTMLNSRFRKLIAMKHPSINLVLQEPPVIRADNYDVGKHGHFHKVWTWKKELCERDPVKYKHYYLPNQLRFSRSSKSFKDRKLLCLINSFMFSVHPRELYSERIRVIRWFEQNAPQDFDLIGVEWDKPLFTGHLSKLNLGIRFFYRRIPAFKHLKVKRFPSFIGPNRKSKGLTLQDYRFSIAYENSIETDYLSEKIFDCLFAGTIPIYLGTPNVLESIPANCFIDKRNFKTYDELYKYISGMSEKEHNGYVDAIEAFIRSPKAQPFSAETYAENFVKHFVNE